MLKVVTVAAVIAVVAPACATRGFVRTETAVVDAKIDTVAATVEETQERTLQNGERIGEVDQRAMEAGQAARMSQAAADGAAMAADAVGMRVDDIEAMAGRLIFEVTLSEDQGNFASGRNDLPDAARARIDQLIGQLSADGQNEFIEIEGHTDSTGGENYNLELGMERAEAVKRYLYEQHNVPLHKMNVFSYGEARPAAPNDTTQGRAQNRRVVIRVRT
jgi:outer membrane protein OmpA-like peptidoglycan-associated protein